MKGEEKIRVPARELLLRPSRPKENTPCAGSYPPPQGAGNVS